MKATTTINLSGTTIEIGPDLTRTETLDAFLQIRKLKKSVVSFYRVYGGGINNNDMFEMVRIKADLGSVALSHDVLISKRNWNAVGRGNPYFPEFAVENINTLTNEHLREICMATIDQTNYRA